MLGKGIYIIALLMLMILATCPVHAVTKSRLALVSLNAHNGQKALDESQALAMAGDREGAQKKYLEAQSIFDEVVLSCQKYNPDKLGLLEAKDYAFAIETAGEYDLAARAYERCYSLDSSLVYNALFAGRNWRKVGEKYYNRALPLLHAVLETPKSTPEFQSQAHTELGHLYHAQGLYTLAGDAYAKALSEDSTNPEALLGNALMQIHQGDVVSASKAINSLGQLSQEQGLYLQQGLPIAITAFESNRIVLPETSEAHYAYSTLLYRVQRISESLMAVEHAVLLDDSDYSMHNRRGGLLMQLGQTARAQAAYTRSLELNPNQPRTQEILNSL